MISKFKEKQEEKEAEFNQKQDCLRAVKEFIENLEDVAVLGEIVSTTQKLSDLEQNDRIITQKQYFEELGSLCGVSLSKWRVIILNLLLNSAEQVEKLIKESFESITAGDWKKMTDHVINVVNKYKERDRIIEEHLESFIINVGSSSEFDESVHVEFMDFDSLE